MMQVLLALVFAVGLASGSSFAEESTKTDQAKPADDRDGDDRAIARCLRVWGGKHPFQGVKNPKYEEVSTNVKVLGAGGPLEDNSDTKEPKLVLVKPSVAVMSKSVMRLLNPNGWYCLKANVTVMAKTVIELACNAAIADSTDGVAVLGSNEEGTGQGVTVLGKTELKRIGCAKK